MLGLMRILQEHDHGVFCSAHLQAQIVGYIGGIHSHNTRSCMVASNIIAMYRAADSRMMNKFVKKVAHLWF